MKAIVHKVLPASVRHMLWRWVRGSEDLQQVVPVSYGYQIIEDEVPAQLLKEWQDPVVAGRQRSTFVPLLRQMHEGNPREDFVAVATAVQMIGLENPLIVEVGCGSGWNSEVLNCLLKRPIRYIGVDYSLAMVELGKRDYAEVPFVVGDATALPFRDGVCDILLSGTVLMHVLGYRQAIRESSRVAHRWCIFHTVPVLQRRETTFLRKKAYGQMTIEVIFNETELLYLLKRSGLAVRHVLNSIPYNLKCVLGESTVTKTYACEVTEC